MVPFAFGLAWVGYSGVFWGYCLVTGRNVSLGQIISPFNYIKDLPAAGSAGNTSIFPNGSAADAANVTTGTPTAGTTAGTTTTTSPAGIANGKAVSAVAAAFGWGKGSQYNALSHIIAAESGGNPLIANPSSGAFGIAQALGHGTACSEAKNVTYQIAGGKTVTGTVNEYGPEYGLTCAQAKAANAGNITDQLKWMLGYIKARYGTPEAAWAYHQKNDSY